MALFATGTVMSSTPSTDFMVIVDSNLLAVGWVFVETYTSSTNVTNIYKSPGSLNSWGIDFYIGVNRASATGIVTVMIGELYDVSTHRFRKYGVGAGSASTPDADGTFVDASGRLPTAMTRGNNHSTSLYSGIACTYYLNCSIDRIIFGFDTMVSSSTGTNPVYVGLYDPLYSFDKFPLCVMTLARGNNVGGTFYGWTTREFNTGAFSSNWTVQIPSNFGTLLYPTAAYGATPDFYTSNYVVCRVPFASSFDPSFALRGLLKDVIFLSAGANFGDALQITHNQTTYTYLRIAQTFAGGGNDIPTVWCPTF